MSKEKQLRRGGCMALAAALIMTTAGSMAFAAETDAADTADVANAANSKKVTVQTYTTDAGSFGDSDSTLSYTFDGSTLTISGSGAMASYYDIAEYPWYAYYDEITAVVIESGVTSIGASAFECGYYGMTSNLKTVTAADTVTAVESYAFSYCDSLESITFEGDAPSFGSDVFYGVTGTAYYPADNSTWTSSVMQDYGGTITWEAYAAGSSDDSGSSDSGDAGDSASSVDWALSGNTLTISGSGAMEDYTNASQAPWYTYKDEITAVVIQSGVTGIGAFAFDNYTNLKSVTIANSVTVIGWYAFEDTGLTAVTLPNSVKTIEGGAFGMCGSLESVTCGTGLTSIGDYAFEECSSLKTFTFKGSAPSFGSYVFYGVTCTVYYPAGSGWTASDRQNYGGTLTWAVLGSSSKSSQTIKVTASSLKKSIKASKLKKKKQTFKIKASAKGKLTYTKKSGNKKITVSKNGKVTVKKGLKKGTYKVKVKIKAAATSKYAAKTVTKTVKITVK